MTTHIKTAIEERSKQLQRQINTAKNPLIKDILQKEREELAVEFDQYMKTKPK